MREDIISFKGLKEGVFLQVKSGDFEKVKNALKEKMEKNAEFYKEVKLVGVVAEDLSEYEIMEIKLLLKYKYDLIVSDKELSERVLEHFRSKKSALESEVQDDESEIEQVFGGIDCGVTKFVYGTLRSGRSVEFDGNVVVVGDVNPGAIVKANGNIIVMGTFRGVAHAGANGNSDAIVACYNLQPMQVRIASSIVRKPDEYVEEVRMPEVAKVKDGQVIIEPYLPNK